ILVACEGGKLRQVLRAAGCCQKLCSVVLGRADVQCDLTQPFLPRMLQRMTGGDQAQVEDQFTTSSEVAGHGQVLKFRPQTSEFGAGARKNFGCAMCVPAAAAALRNSEPLQESALQRSAQSLGLG